jgi:hypothetical protein
LVDNRTNDLAAYDEEARAGLLWTDPPYGVEYEGKTKARLQIKGDRHSELAHLLADSFAQIDAALASGARRIVPRFDLDPR